MPTVNVLIEWPKDVEPLPDTARARITVEDVSRADAASLVLGHAVVADLSVDTPAAATVAVEEVDPRAVIVVRVHVSRDGDLSRASIGDLTTTQSYPVLTRGRDGNVEVRPTVIR